MKLSNALPLIFAGAVGFFATAAFAEDFTFTVPVDFSNLPPEITRAAITCNAYRSAIGGGVGARGAGITITGGAYHGDVTIRFDAYPERDPATATHYECTAVLMGSGEVIYARVGETPTFPLQPGAPFLLDTLIQPIPR
jgi:hypothetical protein